MASWADALFGGDLGLDSIDALEFVVLIEENFGVSIPDETVAKQVLASIDALAEFIVSEQRQRDVHGDAVDGDIDRIRAAAPVANYLYLDGHVTTLTWDAAVRDLYPDKVVLTQDGSYPE